MNSNLSKLLPVAFILSLSLGAFQGNRLQSIKESETFYRWVLSASSLTRLGDTLEPDSSVDLPEAMDDEVFAQLSEVAENLLPDYAIDEEFDLNSDGSIQSRLVRGVRQSKDADIWELIQKTELAETKELFLGYLRSSRIQSSGVQFSASSLYGDAAGVNGVGLTGMFFGFRTLAANFLWLQVDNFWHSGEMHRMVPLMRTCVTFDPNFIDAYLLGAWHLAYNIPAKIQPTPEANKKYNKKYRRRIGLRESWYYMGADFLRDGIRKNPRDYRLYFDLGYAIYEQKLNDHENAIIYLDEARRHKHDRWVPRMLYRSLSLNGQYEDAIEGWTAYLADYPGHDIGTRLLNVNTAYLADTIADESLECKSAAEKALEVFRIQLEQAQTNSEQTEIDRLNQEIQEATAYIQEITLSINQQLNIATSIWTKLYNNTRDTLAQGRLVRRQAILLREQGRYLEAIAELDLIRWQDMQFFEESSNLIIEIKQENNYPLTVSEQLKLLRDEDLANERAKDAAQFEFEDNQRKKKRRVECKYMDERI